MSFIAFPPFVRKLWAMAKSPIHNLRYKDGRRKVLARIPKGGVCAEIGVWKGDFSELILAAARPQELHLVDPWQFVPAYPKRYYGGALARDQRDMDAILLSVITRFAAHPGVRIHRAKSTSATEQFPDRYFDWVYIDGDHSYQAVLDDLRAWHKKTKPDGILCLDDYDWRDEAHELSVRNAVQSFLSKTSVKDARPLQGQFVIVC